MKTLYVTESNTNIVVDDETKTAGRLNAIRRYDIRDIYLIEDAMSVVYGFDGKKEEVTAEPGDIILVMYDYPTIKKHLVVVKSEDWKNSILNRREQDQREKEAWAENRDVCESTNINTKA